MKTKTRKLSGKVIDYVMNSYSEHNAGTKVTEEAIANHFKVSRTPVREIIKHLEHEGLIRTTPYRGITFKKFSKQDVEKIYSARIALEELAARDAAGKVTPQVRERLKYYAYVYRESIKHGNAREGVLADELFHELLMDCSGNWYLKNMVKKIRLLETLFNAAEKGVGLSENKTRDLNPFSHDRIIEALDSGNPEKAAETLKNHIAWSRDKVLSSMGRQKKSPNSTPCKRFGEMTIPKEVTKT